MSSPANPLPATAAVVISDRSITVEALAIPVDPWSYLRRQTTARIALGRTGGSLPTQALLAFAQDHALARDAVHAAFDAESVAGELGKLAGPVLLLESAASDRSSYLQRPDLGRRLSAASAAQLSSLGPSQPQADIVIMVSDGLSALAAERQAAPLLAELLPRLKSAALTLAPLCVVRQARVALQDEVGAILGARLSLLLLGERPGLGTPDSLGAYFTYAPRLGRNDSERNCISNIRAAGLPPAEAAQKLAVMITTALRLQLTGIGLKDPVGRPFISTT